MLTDMKKAAVLAACPPYLRASHTRIADVQRQPNHAPARSTVSTPDTMACGGQSSSAVVRTGQGVQGLAHLADSPAGLL